MSVKIDAIKPAAEISLFDAFGPNVSEQVKVVNLKAAELSMDDMARVMGVTGAALKKPQFVGEEGVSCLPFALLGLAHQVDEKTDDHHSIDSSMAYGVGFRSRWNKVNISKVNPLTLTILRSSTVSSSKDSHVIQEAIESASTNMQRLLDVGVDSRSMVIAINYKDPQTGAPRTLTLEEESTAGIRAIFTKKIRTKKPRRSGRNIPPVVATAKK
ncbi:hypothetical protein SOASR015_21480 [Pectobacterium carotovorum subsp. carotovorum]|nr:hypothetical protein SOASR015_21480 [Pectobacterium carotovorum subsp. carotovorum]GLX57365.1 hypothetical protein Pcaca02_26740 [Pectobacterium carotovorum subsp. carotovorum]